jgi:hypothetical protein
MADLHLDGAAARHDAAALDAALRHATHAHTAHTHTTQAIMTTTSSRQPSTSFENQ